VSTLVVMLVIPVVLARHFKKREFRRDLTTNLTNLTN
jgi:hypothetical protein